MDVLSEVLKGIKLDGAMFYNAEFSAPWCFHSPASPVLAPYLSATSKHVIIFHLLTEGRGYAQIEADGRSLALSGGGPRNSSARRSTCHEKRTVHQIGGSFGRSAAGSRARSQAFADRRRRGGHKIHLRLHGLRAATMSGRARRAATHCEGQCPRRRIRSMAGTIHPLFGGSCRSVRARW